MSMSLEAIEKLPAEVLVKSRKAAAILGKTDGALRNHRLRGTGPDYMKLANGHVRYRVSDLAAWEDRK